MIRQGSVAANGPARRNRPRPPHIDSTLQCSRHSANSVARGDVDVFTDASIAADNRLPIIDTVGFAGKPFTGIGEIGHAKIKVDRCNLRAETGGRYSAAKLPIRWACLVLGSSRSQLRLRRPSRRDRDASTTIMVRTLTLSPREKRLLRRLAGRANSTFVGSSVDVPLGFLIHVNGRFGWLSFPFLKKE